MLTIIGNGDIGKVEVVVAKSITASGKYNSGTEKELIIVGKP